MASKLFEERRNACLNGECDILLPLQAKRYRILRNKWHSISKAWLRMRLRVSNEKKGQSLFLILLLAQRF